MKNIGYIHLISAAGALVAGTTALINTKGTRPHKIWGYLYLSFMISLNGTALLIDNLFGNWGPFHYAAIVSLATILLGMVPMLTKQSNRQRLFQHMTFMYYSVVGLYAAFFSEKLSRCFPNFFIWAVCTSTLATVMAGSVLFVVLKRHWSFH